MIISVLYFLHHSRIILEADLISSSHLSSGSFAHTVKYLVEHFDLLLAQRLLNGDVF